MARNERNKQRSYTPLASYEVIKSAVPTSPSAGYNIRSDIEHTRIVRCRRRKSGEKADYTLLCGTRDSRQRREEEKCDAEEGEHVGRDTGRTTATGTIKPLRD